MIRILVFTLALVAWQGAQVPAADPARPNVVLILADDLGWSDLGCQGGDLVETPHIDRLAAEGMRFRQAYAMSVCSPTRAALMTGKHPARLRMTIWSEGALKGPQDRRLLEGESRYDLPLSETTLARRLREAGYLTALVGKWHLGDANHYPEAHGFDVNIGGTHWGAPATYWWPYRGEFGQGKELRYVPHLEFGQPGEYLTDRLTDEALRVIDRAGQRPFFLYLAHHGPHTPLDAKPDDIRHFAAKLNPQLKHQHPVQAAMVKSVDDSVGRVLEHLRKRGLEENTVVIFASDNGGFIGVREGAGYRAAVTNNAPLRSGKGALYEGGIRVPLMVRWPGLTRPGTQSDEPVIAMDLFHTLCAALCPERQTDASADGLDLAPLLKAPEARLPKRDLHFHYPHYYETTTPVSALRSGDWKLLEYLEDGRLELYDLRDDASESTNLAASRPAEAARLRERLHAWRDQVDAAMPRPNPAYQAERRKTR